MHKTKQDRQKEAKERQYQRNQRSVEQQIALIRKRPGKSASELDRLLRRRQIFRQRKGQ